MFLFLLFKGVLIGDKNLEELETKTSNEDILKNEMKPCVYAGIELKKEEEKILLYAPNHLTFPKIDITKFETEYKKSTIYYKYLASVLIFIFRFGGYEGASASEY